MTEPQKSFTEPPKGFQIIRQEPEPPKSFKELPEGAVLEPPKSLKELPENAVLEDDLSIDEIKKMQSEGVKLSEKLQRKLFEAEDERGLLDKAAGAASAFLPAAADIIGQTASGAFELANKAVVQPAAFALSGGYNRLDSEEAKKVFKDREEALRSLAVGVAKDTEETANAAVRAIYFGTGITDKLLGKSKEERFRRWQDRQAMRDLEAQSLAENPDRAAYLLSQNPLIQGYVEYEAKKMGLSPEEVEKVKQDYIQTMLDQGLTKEQINQNISALGEFISPVSVPGAGKLSDVALKPLSKITAPVMNKASELAVRGTSKLAQGTEYAANKVLQGTELLQTGARKIGEYAINDPDTWIKGTVNTAIMPVVGVAKPVSATARVIRDITNIDIGGTAGRKGMVEMAGQRIDSSDLTKRLFGTQGKGGVARAKLADWTIRQSNALIQPGVNAAAMNVVMGLPDIETAEDLGFTAGTGFGIGSLAGARSYERLSGLVDPRKTMAEKITNFVTPDPAAYRRDEDADIKRFMAQASPDIVQNITDLADIEKRKAAVDATIASLEKERDAQIDPEDAAFKQTQIDGFLKQKEALSKATPETQAEALRQTQLAFIDAYDLAQSTGGVAGLRGVKIAVLDPNNAEQFFRDLYGDSLKQAETTINLLTGIPSLTETDSQKLTEARQLLEKFQNDVEGAKATRGFAIQEDNTDPNSKDFVPPHLRRINQQGATAVINADLIKHLSSQGFNLRHTLQHEVQHAVQQFAEVQRMLAPLRGQLFDQKIKNDDGTTEVYQQGIYSDEDLNRYAARYAKLMSPSDDGASFYAQFGGDSEKMRAYIKDEILAETAAASGEYAGGTRASLDDVGRNVMDWLEVKTKSGRLKQLKEALRRNGIIFDNVGAISSILDAQMSPETLAMVRQYQRGLKDFDGTMTVQQSRESDEPDIPLTKVLGSIALQNKYRHADFFEKEQIIKATAPDGSVTEIVIPKEAKIDPFIDVYRTQGGQLVDANGNVVTLGPEITFGSMPDGTTFEVDTRIARKSNGSPIILTNREMKSRALERTKMIQNAIDSAKDDGSGVRLSDTGNGNYRGVMSPAQIEAFMALPNHVVSPNLKRMTKFFNELMARNDGTRVVMEYQAALLNGKYKALSPKIRDEVPIGFQLTKDGNFLLTTISVSRLYDKMQAWADKKPMNLQPWNGDTNAFWDSVTKYLDNHAKGEKGETGLHPDSYIAGRMKNRINDLFNAYNADTKESNPERSTLPRARGKDNLDTVIRGRRLDRINNFEESPSQKIPINYGYLTTNYMPAVNPMAAPMTAEEVQNRFDGSVTATRVRRAMATGEIDALESELRQMDDLLPTESLQLVQGEDQLPRIQIVSMFDPNNTPSLEPEEIVSDIDAETEAELAILDAQDGTVPPQDLAKVLSSKLDQLYADGGRSPIIPVLETELEKINQQLELQAQEQAAATMQAEEATQSAEEVTPVTQFMPATIEAPSGERGFKSKLQTEIQRNFKGARATPEQLKSVLGNPQNVKPEEVKWSGVMDEIDRLAQENNGKVPVQELLNYLRNEGQVKFKEVTFGNDNEIQKIADQYRIKIEDEYGERAFYDEFDDPLEFDELPFELQNAIDNSKNQPESKFAQYQLPGGENYREVVLSMPLKTELPNEFSVVEKPNNPAKSRWIILGPGPLSENRYSSGPTREYAIQNFNRLHDKNFYTSSHFPDIPNYIAHMRLNERTDAEGNEGLFVEEFQSDRHQAGREKGYLEDKTFGDLTNEQQARMEYLNNEAPTPLSPNELEELNSLRSQARQARNPSLREGIPDAPFRKDWGVQLFKRALRDAVDSGKSWIGWTTGDTQAERYDLSKQIGKVVWNEDTKMLIAYDPSQKRAVIQESNITSGKLADYVGKEVAQKLVEQSPDEDMDRQISGLDLKVGGEGMKGFYDQILPKEIGKYVDKMGGKVEKSEISAGKKYNFELFNPQGEPKSVFVLRDQITGKFLADSEKETFSSRAEDGELMSQKTAESMVEAFAKNTDTPIWRVNITPDMEAVVRTGQMQFMPAENTASLSDLPTPEAQQDVEKPLGMVKLPKAVERTMKEDAGDFSVVIGGKPGKYGFGYTTIADLAPTLELSQDRKKYLTESLSPRNDELNKKRDALLEVGNLFWEKVDIYKKDEKSDEDIKRLEDIDKFFKEFISDPDKEISLGDAIQVAEVDRLTRSINLMNRGMVPAPFKFPVDNREVPTPVEKPADISPDASKEDKAKYAKELAAYEAYVALLKKREQDVSTGLKSLQGAVATLFKTKKFKEFIAEAAGLSGIQFDNILGTWKFEPEPSFVFSAEGMTWEQAQSVTKWLSVLMTQDAGIAWKPSIGLTEGAPSVYLVHDKKLTEEQILNAFKKAKEVGIDGLSVTVDGKGIKAANFDNIDGFESKLVEIQKAANIKNFHNTLVDSFYYDTTSDFTADDGSLKVPDWIKGESINEENIQNQQGGMGQEVRESGGDTTTSGFPILLRRGIDSVLIPYAKALAGEGFTFDPDRFAERYGLGQEVADYIREQLYPTTGLSRSVTPILDGTEKFTVPESYYTKGGRLKTSVNDLMYALQKRSADDGFIQPGDYSTRAGQIIAETIVDEIEGHMERAAKNPKAPNAIGWYDTALKKMKQKYSEFFPFLNRGTPTYDADKEFIFDSVLGIASQGNNVFENGKMAARVQFLLESGKTLPEIVKDLYGTFGGETRAIENNLLKLDELIKNNGIQTLDKLFRKKMTVSEWNSYFKKNKNLWFKGKPLTVDGQADQMVTGFSVFGPKIGSFINNLHGDYTTLTADLWFTRTWNRILGNVFQHAPLKEANQYDTFRKAILEQYRSDSAQSAGEKFEPLLKRVNKDGEKEFFDYMQEPELDGISRDNLDKLLADPQKMLELATALEDRYRKGQYKAKSDLRRAAKNWVENRTDPVAAPRTDLERDFQQTVMEIAQKKLRRKGIKISIADMQAALWYNEKELFGLYGAQVSGSEPADYADAAENVDEIMSYASLFKVNRLVEVDGKKRTEIVRLLTPDEEVALTGVKNAKTPEEYVALLAARKKAEDDKNAAEKKLEEAELKVAKFERELAAATDEKSKEKLQASLEKAKMTLSNLTGENKE